MGPNGEKINFRDPHGRAVTLVTKYVKKWFFEVFEGIDSTFIKKFLYSFNLLVNTHLLTPFEIFENEVYIPN